MANSAKRRAAFLPVETDASRDPFLPRIVMTLHGIVIPKLSRLRREFEFVIGIKPQWITHVQYGVRSAIDAYRSNRSRTFFSRRVYEITRPCLLNLLGRIMSISVNCNTFTKNNISLFIYSHFITKL